MSKRLLALVLALVVCFSFAGCGNDTEEKDKDVDKSIVAQEKADESEKGSDSENVKKDDKEEQRESTVTPILYKATDDKGNVVWLFGSIHIGRDDYYPLPDYVLDAYDGSDALAVELDILAFEKDIKAQTRALSKLIYADGTKISDHISKSTYNKAVEIMEEQGLYNSMLDYYIPSLWSQFVDQCLFMELDVDFDSGIDKNMLKMAKNDDKEILEVESGEFQYGMMADYSEDLQKLLLENSVEAYDELDDAKEELDELLELWAIGDENGISEMLSEEDLEELTADEKKIYEEYHNVMIVERNESMTQYAVDALKSGKEVFICVGAAHVIGEGAIAQNLKDLGYKVERVQ